ncbi:MAG: xylosidase, partial [Chitinophagaceae bacterium]
HGKPLVAIWGLGFPDRPYNIRNIGILKLINFLKYDPKYGGCSVMLGVPTFWRDLDADCLPDPYLHEIIRHADLIMPWTVQRFSPLLYEDMDRYRDLLVNDMKWCEKNHIGYVPCVYPGFSWHNLSTFAFPNNVMPVASIPRRGGKFYWEQISTALWVGAQMLYVAMFDEINEGTAIFKCTDTPPVSQYAQFAGMDGKPSDYYLWLTGQASKMLKNEEPLSVQLPERKK